MALILALAAGNAFFVGSEIALTSARRSRIKQLPMPATGMRGSFSFCTTSRSASTG